MSFGARERVAHRALPERGARRDKSLVAPWLAFPASSSCRGLVLRAAVPASSSCRGLAPFGRSSRQAPLAGALCLVLNTLFLNGPKRDHGGFWRSPGKPCRGVLRLPVQKFGVLRYPYFSTPTGAPGPGPYTVSSAVGPGPNQCTGTRGLGHAESYSASTTPSPNGTRRLRRRGERRV